MSVMWGCDRCGASEPCRWGLGPTEPSGWETVLGMHICSACVKALHKWLTTWEAGR